MKKCGYCKTEKAQGVSDMLSNGYCVCEECSMNQFGKKIAELETMAQAKAKEAAAYRKQKLESGTAVVTKHNVHLYYELMSDEDKLSYIDVIHPTLYNRVLYIDDVLKLNQSKQMMLNYTIYTYHKIDGESFLLEAALFGVKDTLKLIDKYIEDIKASNDYISYNDNIGSL